MKNILRYYYNLKISKIVKKNDYYVINNDYELYYFIPFWGDIDNLIYLYSNFINRKLYIHQILLNKDNKIITMLNNKNYILIKINVSKKNISSSDIINFPFFIERGTCNWSNLWSEKLDYYEYNINKNKLKYKELYKSFYYYAGMCESSIELLNTINNDINLYVNHRRIKKDISTIDFYNPLNMILDSKVRDICEYFKEHFFYESNPIKKVKNYLNSTYLTNQEAVLFLARIMYPSYYFDIYDELINGSINKGRLLFIISKNEEFEQFLKEIYLYLKKKYNIPEIEWIIKK